MKLKLSLFFFVFFFCSFCMYAQKEAENLYDTKKINKSYRLKELSEKKAALPLHVRQNKDGLYGYADENNNFIIKPVFSSATDFNEHGVAVVEMGMPEKYYNGQSRWGLLNNKGQLIIAPILSEITPLSNGCFRIQKGKKFGLISHDGIVITDIKYDNIALHKKERCYVAEESYNNSYLLDKEGKEVLSASSIKSISDEYFVFKKDYKYGVVDYKGNIVVPNSYGWEINNFFEEDTLFVFERSSGKVDAINKNGEIIVADKYIKKITSHRYVVEDRDIEDNNKGLIDNVGREIIPCKFNSIEKLSDSNDSIYYSTLGEEQRTMYLVSILGKESIHGNEYTKGVVDNTGKEIVPCKYTYVGEYKYNPNYIYTIYDKRYGVLYDKLGNVVIRNCDIMSPPNDNQDIWCHCLDNSVSVFNLKTRQSTLIASGIRIKDLQPVENNALLFDGKAIYKGKHVRFNEEGIITGKYIFKDLGIDVSRKDNTQLPFDISIVDVSKYSRSQHGRYDDMYVRMTETGPRVMAINDVDCYCWVCYAPMGCGYDHQGTMSQLSTFEQKYALNHCLVKAGHPLGCLINIISDDKVWNCANFSQVEEIEYNGRIYTYIKGNDVALTTDYERGMVYCLYDNCYEKDRRFDNISIIERYDANNDTTLSPVRIPLNQIRRQFGKTKSTSFDIPEEISPINYYSRLSGLRSFHVLDNGMIMIVSKINDTNDFVCLIDVDEKKVVKCQEIHSDALVNRVFKFEGVNYISYHYLTPRYCASKYGGFYLFSEEGLMFSKYDNNLNQEWAVCVKKDRHDVVINDVTEDEEFVYAIGISQSMPYVNDDNAVVWQISKKSHQVKCIPLLKKRGTRARSGVLYNGRLYAIIEEGGNDE